MNSKYINISFQQSIYDFDAIQSPLSAVMMMTVDLLSMHFRFASCMYSHTGEVPHVKELKGDGYFVRRNILTVPPHVIITKYLVARIHHGL